MACGMNSRSGKHAMDLTILFRRWLEMDWTCDRIECTLLCSAKWNSGRPCLCRSSERGGPNRYRGLLVAISRILLSRQSANFERISFGQFQLQSFPSSPREEKLARVISVRKEENSSDEDSRGFRQLSSPSSRFLLLSRLPLVDIVFIIGLKPSARLRARLSPNRRLKATLSARARAANAFFRFATCFRSYAGVFIVTGGKTAY